MDLKESNNFFVLILRTARPRQWLKNLALYAAIVFGGNLFKIDALFDITFAFFIFCGISSSVYIINDIFDAERDRAHPFKKIRPIASGKLSPRRALITALVLIAFFFYLSTKISVHFSWLVALYVALQVVYSLKLRNIIIIDALTVAAGFILRVIAGSVAVLTSISSWLILATIGISMLLAFGKRRSEKTLLATELLKEPSPKTTTRMTLAHYPDNLLDSMISMSSSLVIMTYALFTFQISASRSPKFFTSLLPSTLAQPKWMMLSIPFVIYGVARYLYVIYEKKGGESPERVLLSDKPLLATVVLWFLLVMGIIYGTYEFV